jgi:hypothetical protein
VPHRLTTGAADASEQWFLDHGLPYFVDHIREQVQHRLSPARIVVVLAVGALLGAAAGVGTGLWSRLASVGVTTGITVLLGVVLLYGLRALEAGTIARWALVRAFGSLGMLFPLATRALPMLLLFITFLFINTEVWQVCDALDGGTLWGVVLVFAIAATGFLTARLDEELDEFDDDVQVDDLLESTRGTQWQDAARDLADRGVDLAPYAEVTGLQKVNLVLVLVIAQAVQVVLLALAVFGFFMVFGAVAIDDSVIKAWTGHAATYPWDIQLFSPVLTRVSIFLAGFSGLYFTVYAVTDETYRKQFFTAIMRELAQVVSVRIVYRELRRPDRDPTG